MFLKKEKQGRESLEPGILADDFSLSKENATKTSH